MSRFLETLAVLARGLARLPALLRLGLEALDTETDEPGFPEKPPIAPERGHGTQSVPTYSLKSASPSFQIPRRPQSGFETGLNSEAAAPSYPGLAGALKRDEPYEKAVDAMYLRLLRDARLTSQTMGEEA